LIDLCHEVLIVFEVMVFTLFSQTSAFDMFISGGWCYLLSILI
jgi:hypothetical protein